MRQLKPYRIFQQIYNPLQRESVQSRGKLQLDFLKKHGLKPHHSLLDIGCARLWGGQFFIEYLDVNKYCGIDNNLEVIKACEVLIEHLNFLSSKNPTIMLSNDCLFDLDIKFDFGIASGIFNHNTIETLRQYLYNLHKKIDMFFLDMNLANIDYIYQESENSIVSMFTYDTLCKGIDGICYLIKVDGSFSHFHADLSKYPGVKCIERQIFQVKWM
uniref:Putative methyltransferase n=1 Tax=viral metagenome TaxID=1070528 RepID=A0A6M3LI09_9ZZZZ